MSSAITAAVITVRRGNDWWVVRLPEKKNVEAAVWGIVFSLLEVEVRRNFRGKTCSGSRSGRSFTVGCSRTHDPWRRHHSPAYRIKSHRLATLLSHWMCSQLILTAVGPCERSVGLGRIPGPNETERLRTETKISVANKTNSSSAKVVLRGHRPTSGTC